MKTKMRSVFPELSDEEYRQNIQHFEDENDVVLETLTRRSPQRGVDDWILEVESYPFQRYLRTLAVRSLDSFPAALTAATFGSENNARSVFLGRVEERLGKVMIRSLVAAINSARQQGLLEGDSPELRYEAFVDLCIREGVEAASGIDFSLLDHQRDHVVRCEVSFLCEMAARLAMDRAAIATHFGIDESLGLTSYSADAGDTHNGGRGVCILEFEGGERLVYKPRSISGEDAFGRIAADCNEAFGTKILYPRCLARERYGYVEFIQEGPREAGLETFLGQCGELLALMFLLNARDMHYENLISTGAGPVAIDLETILHPARVFQGPVSIAEGNAGDLVERSVAAIGILPMMVRGADDAGFVDLGFLGGQEDAISPFRALQFAKPFTDEVSLIFAHAAIPDRPAVFSEIEEADVIRLGLIMADAFERVLLSVQGDTQVWIEILDRHASDLLIRYIHNPTVVYDRALRLASSARAMVDAEYASALLGRIALHSGDSDPALVRSEMRQLALRDVPYFLVHSSGTEVMNGDLSATGAQVAAAPLAEAKAKASELSAEAIKRETDIIRLAFVARFPDDRFGEACDTARPAYAPNDLVDLASELAAEVVAGVLPDRFEHLPKTWIGPLVSADSDQPWNTGAMGYDLYTGRMGPALATLAAGRALNSVACTDLATEIFDRSAEILLGDDYEERTLRQIGVGAFTGLSGMAFAMNAASKISGIERWQTAAGVICTIIEELLADSTQGPLGNDVIAGSPGVILALRNVGTPQSEALIRKLASELAGSIVAGDSPELVPVFEQCGVAHGVSGLMLALCHAAMLGSPAPEVVAAVDKLLVRLDGFFSDDARRWKSRRDDRFTFTTGWCHGAAGVGVALAAHQRAFGACEETSDRLGYAVAAIDEDGFGRNLTWCHGDLGNHDALTAIGELVPLVADIQSRAEQRWLHPQNLKAGRGDSKSRYSYAKSIMVGSAGILLHLVNRIQSDFTVSPTRLAVSVAGDDQ